MQRRGGAPGGHREVKREEKWCWDGKEGDAAKEKESKLRNGNEKRGKKRSKTEQKRRRKRRWWWRSLAKVTEMNPDWSSFPGENTNTNTLRLFLWEIVFCPPHSYMSCKVKAPVEPVDHKRGLNETESPSNTWPQCQPSNSPLKERRTDEMAFIHISTCNQTDLLKPQSETKTGAAVLLNILIEERTEN